jgi:Glycosyltransferase family 87
MAGSANGDGGAYRPGPARAGVAAPPGPAATADGPSAPDRVRTVLVWIAAVGIVAAAAVMVAVSVAGPSLSVVTISQPTAGPPWWIWLHPSPARVTFALWGAVLAGGTGVIAGLVAVARGARPPVRVLLAFAALVVGVLTVLPAAGSTDIGDYAANGRMAATGHSPYVMTPLQLKRSGDPIGRWIPSTWETSVSVYGPVATAEEWAAAELGGPSMARVTFWLKLWNSIAFGVVVLLLDRTLRADPARRLRAHLLWTVNPLLLWEIVASGHIDGLAAAFGLMGVLIVRRRPGPADGGARPPAVARFLLAGLGIGVAAAIKIPFAAFGLGVLWAGRRSVTALAAAAAGLLVVLGPAYALTGRPAVSVLLHRGPATTWDTMYQIFYRPLGYTTFGAFTVPPHLTLIAAVAFLAVAVLAVLRLPDGTPDLPALSPALALSLAWLLVWSYQRPWYDVMAICLLAVYPASQLDWLVLGRLILTAPVYLPGVPGPTPAWLTSTINAVGDYVAPDARLVAALAFVALCLTGRWAWRGPEFRPPGNRQQPSAAR